MKKKTDQYPHARAYRDRHGKVRWRFREKGFSAVLGTDWGSEDFRRRYAQAVNRQKTRPVGDAAPPVEGTFDAVVREFYKLHFKSLAAATRKDYRACLEPLREKYGDRRVAGISRRSVLKIKADLSETPAQANKVLKRLSQVLELAVESGYLTNNPARGVKRYRLVSKGYHTWTEAEIERFYEAYPLGTIPHLAMSLILYTGAARVDAVKLGRGNIQRGRLEYRRQKTIRNPGGVVISLPIHPELERVLRTVRPGAFSFLGSGFITNR